MVRESLPLRFFLYGLIARRMNAPGYGAFTASFADSLNFVEGNTSRLSASGPRCRAPPPQIRFPRRGKEDRIPFRTEASTLDSGVWSRPYRTDGGWSPRPACDQEPLSCLTIPPRLETAAAIVEFRNSLFWDNDTSIRSAGCRSIRNRLPVRLRTKARLTTSAARAAARSSSLIRSSTRAQAGRLRQRGWRREAAAVPAGRSPPLMHKWLPSTPSVE